MSMSPKIDTEQRKAIAKRKSRLELVTPLVHEWVNIPETDTAFLVARPESIDSVLDHVIDDPEQNLPYWAEIWPSGIALASEILQKPELVSGLPVIELGSGVGITAAAAMVAGANLTITDYWPLSLLLAEMNCLRAGQAAPPSRQVNWRDPRAHLLQDSGKQWPVVLAADVLYEQRDIEPVLNVLDRITDPDGIVLLAEPGRRPAKEAMELAAGRGWQMQTRQYSGPWPDPKEADVVVTVHSMKRS